MRYYEYMLDKSKHEELKEGDKVRVVGNYLEGCWDIGHVGFVYALDGRHCRVSETDGKQTSCNWYRYEDLELVEQEPPQGDNVNHPSHYNESGIECIEAIKANLGPKGFQAYCKGNCMKYIWRYEYKNGLEDLKKAQVYLNWMVESLEKGEN